MDKKYKYVLTSGKLSINHNFDVNMNDVKVETIEKTPTFIHTISSYPNGFVIETKQWKDKIEIETNYPIEEQDDGSLSINMD